MSRYNNRLKHLAYVSPSITNFQATRCGALTLLMALLKFPAPWGRAMLGILILSRSCVSANRSSEIASILHRPIRSVSFPPNSNMGIFLALAVPLEDPFNSVSLSYFFEANYGLPVNESYFENAHDSTTSPPLAPARNRMRRSIDRSTVYAVLQNKFESAGFPGHECLLRSICEASEYPLEHNGILGDVFHVIFTPSSSRPEDHLPDGIIEAELKGRNESCLDYYSLCPLGLFDLIGILR